MGRRRSVVAATAFVATVMGAFGSLIAAEGTLTAAKQSCVVPEYKSSCSVEITWSTVGQVKDETYVLSDTPELNTLIAKGDAGSATVPVLYPSRTFYLYNNETLLAKTLVRATCAPGTAWVGTRCMVP